MAQRSMKTTTNKPANSKPRAPRGKRIVVGDRAATIKEKSRVYEGFLNLDQAVVSYKRYDGRHQTVTRLCLERGDSVSVLLFDRARKTVLLTEQFRYPTLQKGPGWIVETPAGSMEADEKDPAKTARKEVLEETGIQAGKLEHVGSFYVSPGGTSERIFLYYAEVDSTGRDLALARQLQDADEDIKTLEITADRFMAQALEGSIDDAKTLIAALWLHANRKRLRI